MSPPLVIDIYHGDVVRSFEQVKASGIVGVIHKASQGFTYDHAYSTRRKQALAAGLKWGAYHFMTSNLGGADQANYFLSAADVDDQTLVALDWESLGNVTPSVNRAQLFLEEIIAKLGRKAKIYSGNVAKEQVKGKDEFFGSHDLWLAQYGTHWSVQESWTFPWLWQNNGDSYGPGPHHIPGMSGLVDNNCVVPPMTVEQLLATWAAEIPQIPVEQPAGV